MFIFKKRSAIDYCIQVVRNTFSNEMVKEISSSEFNRNMSLTEEVILINQDSAKKVLLMDNWPFSIITDDNCEQIYIAFANEKKGVTKIICFIVDGIDHDVVDDLARNNGIIRITR